MKNRKSALRKAVMAAMLAGAITTTGGVKAEGKRNPAIPQLLLAISKVKENRSDDLLEKLADVFANLGEYEIISGGCYFWGRTRRAAERLSTSFTTA